MGGRQWTHPVKLDIMAIKLRSRGFSMCRVLMLLCLIGGLTAGGLTAHADEFLFPKTGKHAFRVDLPKGWKTRLDKRGGMLLVPPYQHAMIYLGIVVDDKLRNQPDRAVADAFAKIVGIEQINREGGARVTSANGTAIYRGTAFSGTMPAEHGLARRAKIMIFRLEPNTWAQVWTVTQPGMNAVESDALDRVLNRITLTSDKN
jgi:hypothetical protein